MNPPVRPSRISLPATLAYAGLFVALLYLLFFHLAPDAPMHSTGPPPGAALLKNIDAIIATAANGRGVEYHVVASPQDWAANGKFFSMVYFNAVYHQYPQLVLVGDGGSIINFPTDLQRADRVPPDPWLHQHRVAAVVSLNSGNENEPPVLIHQVP